MAKQDVLDAINATIAPNNIKGITAESLNNVLTMMAENAGEGGGSGDGALRVIVPEMMVFGLDFIHIGEFSPTSWEETKSLMEQVGVDLSEYDAAVKASFEHNANIAQQIFEKGKAGQGVSVVLDQTPYFPAAINVLFQMEPEMVAFYEDFSMCSVQPAGLFMQYMKPTPEGEPIVGGEVFSCALAPTGFLDGGYLSNMMIGLNLDGSLTFTPIEEEQPSSGSGVVFYTTLSGEITEEQKEKNVAAFSKYAAGIPVSVIVNNESLDSTYHPFTTAFYAESDYVLCGFPIKKSDDSFASMRFNKDGSVVMQME